MSDDYDEDYENEVEEQEAEVPEWRFTPYDIIGWVFSTIANMLGALGHGFGGIGMEFFAAGRNWRNKKLLEEYRRERAEEQEKFDAQFTSLVTPLRPVVFEQHIVNPPKDEDDES